MLVKNHRSYLRHRNVQIQFQRKYQESIKKEFEVPDDWFVLNEIRLAVRPRGWAFYLFIIVLVFGLAVWGIWGIG